MADPFKRSSVDGMEDSVIPLTVVDQLFLKSLPPVIALRLESPANETSGDRITQQWVLTRDQAEFLMNSLRECLDSTEYSRRPMRRGLEACVWSTQPARAQMVRFCCVASISSCHLRTGTSGELHDFQTPLRLFLQVSQAWVFLHAVGVVSAVLTDVFSRRSQLVFPLCPQETNLVQFGSVISGD